MRLRTLILLPIFFACILAAQETPKPHSPKLELSGGFSYASVHLTTLLLPYSTQPVQSPFPSSALSMTPVPVRMNMNGWEAGLKLQLPHRLGIATDFSGLYSNASHSASSTLLYSPNGSTVLTETYTYTVSRPRIYTLLAGPEIQLPTGKLKSYLHVLGGSRIPHYDLGVHIQSGNYATTSGYSRGYSPDPQWAMTVGGGVERDIRKHLAWRVGCDYLTNRGHDQNHVRAVAGLVWQPGK